MSAELLTNISSALPQLYGDQVVRQWNRVARLAGLIPVKPGKGKNVAWDVEFSGAAAATYTEGSDVSTYAQDPIVPATLDFGWYRSTFSLSDLEVAIAKQSKDAPAALMDIMGERMVGSISKLSSTINAALFTGAGGSGEILGLLGGVLANTGSYAGVYRTTGGTNYTEWMSTILGNSSVDRALTVDLMAQLEQSIFEDSGTTPTFYVCSPGVYRKYSGLFETIRRVEGDGRGPMVYGTGAAELFYKGVPVFRDKDCTAKYMIAVNTDFLEIEVVGQPIDPTAVSNGTQSAVSSNGQNAAPLQIPVTVQPLAKLGDSQRFQTKVYIQLKCTRPNTMGYINDISES